MEKQLPNDGRIHIRFTDKIEPDYGLNYLQSYMERYPKKTYAEVLSIIFKEHAELSLVHSDNELLADMLEKKLVASFRPFFQRAGAADKNTRVLLELWNGYLFTNGQEDYPTTKEILTSPLKNALGKVEEDIKGAITRNQEKKQKQEWKDQAPE